MVRIGPWAATVCFGETDRFFVVQKQGGIVDVVGEKKWKAEKRKGTKDGGLPVQQYTENLS